MIYTFPANVRPWLCPNCNWFMLKKGYRGKDRIVGYRCKKCSHEIRLNINVHVSVPQFARELGKPDQVVMPIDV